VPFSETGFLCTRAFSINGIPRLLLRVYQPPPFPCYRRPIFSHNKWVIHEDETSVCNMMINDNITTHALDGGGGRAVRKV